MNLQARIENFIFRLPSKEPAPIRLHWRRIYILPTRHGFTFALTLLLLFIGSINYTLSLGFLMTFFLAALGVVAILHTFRNLQDLRIRWRGPEPIFAGESAVFTLLFESAHKSGHFSIDTISQGKNRHVVEMPTETGQAQIPVRSEKRGILRLGRVIVETRYPLGLFRAWARLSPDVFCIVYPVPANDKIPLPLPDGDAGNGNAIIAGDEELQFLRPYRLGDSPRRIAWHAYARERGLLTKQFGADAGGEIWLDLNQAPERDLEARLSRLTRWVLDADAAGIPYGLRLPGAEVPPAHGDAHRRQCLEQLALFGNVITEAPN
ncbi:MAG TPA: DUF58 domain-containing protein [Burkholderiales bacterium]|jgi:uncharacterized protein (DUF58 family)|nr:DUF58 domain-containing protein [Burkholderiales bacterium]